MSTKKTKAPTKKAIALVGEFQAKAKAVAGVSGTVVKANAATGLEAGKLLAGGLKAIGTATLADGKAAVANLSDDLSTIANVKAPGELLQVQKAMAARNFKAISATSSRNFADLRTLITEKVAPLVTKQVKANLDLLRKAA